MKSIIVPTDFSATSVNAARYAVEIAKQVQADIILLHVLPLPVMVPEAPFASDSYEVTIEDAKKSLSELKDKLDGYANGEVNISYRTTTDSFVEQIGDFNDDKDVFAMIMGTSGAGNAEAIFLGSFSLTATKHLLRPLIVVPPHAPFKPIQKIGLGCDMENVSDTVPFSGIKDMCLQFKAKLEVLYVAKSDEKVQPQVLSETKFMQNSLAGLHPEIRITTNSDTKEGLEEFVRSSGIDLLILIPKERNFLESIFHRSMTKKMVLNPDVPVMILH